VQVMPMPEAGDFRVQLGDAETKRIRGEIDGMVNQRLHAATKDLWDRLYASIQHVVERLGDPQNVFRDSLISNVSELCDLLPRLNVTGDPELERTRKEVVAKLGKLRPAEIRHNKVERRKAADAAKDIMERMKGFMGHETK